MRRIATVLLIAAGALSAERRALLVGIGDYNQAAAFPRLAGPNNDVPALRDVLTGTYGFSDVTVLLNKEATRAAILDQLGKLRSRTKRGDYVVFYFSGHGTSHFDVAARNWGIDPNTGALLAFDFRPGSDEFINAQLIVGKRDLRPIFAEIERSATLLALFDTCYSGDAAKSAAKPANVRYVPPASLRSAPAAKRNDMDDDSDAPVSADTVEKSPFPYTRVISVAAAGKFQPARDITEDEIRHDPSVSFDRKAHGVFTEALLRGLKGPADRNRDGRISHEELFQYLQERAITWSHQPVMQAAPDASALLASAVFERQEGDFQPERPRAHGPIAVMTEALGEAQQTRIQALPRIVLSNHHPYDLLVRGTRGGFDLFDAAGTAIADATLSEQDMLRRVAAQPDLQDLLDLRYEQRFNVSLRTQPEGQSVWFEGQNIAFLAHTERRAYLLLLNIDVTGAVTVNYPYRERGRAFEPGDYSELDSGGRIEGPFGVEYLKLFAFIVKPDGYDDLIAGADERPRTLLPGSPAFRRLLTMLRSAGEGAAETRMRVVTVPKPKGSRP